MGELGSRREGSQTLGVELLQNRVSFGDAMPKGTVKNGASDSEYAEGPGSIREALDSRGLRVKAESEVYETSRNVEVETSEGRQRHERWSRFNLLGLLGFTVEDP
jgi:hypothetical protein